MFGEGGVASLGGGGRLERVRCLDVRLGGGGVRCWGGG